MNVTLTKEQLRFIAEKVRSGSYRTATEVVRDGIRLLMQREDERRRYETWKEDVRRKIDEGMEQLERGEFLDGEEVFEDLQQRIDDYRSEERRVGKECRL